MTSIDRFSTRPCPLSTSEARSISAWRCAAWRGGKAGLWLGEGGSDVLGQRRLVLLHRQDIITAPFDHGRADIAVREHGIAADDFALQRQHPQQLQRGLVLVGLGIYPELGQDRLDLRGVGGDQVDPGRVAIAAAPGGLAVDGDVGSVARPESPLDPLPDPRLEVGDVNPAEDARVGRLAEASAGGEPEESGTPSPAPCRLDDGFVTGHAGKHGDNGQAEQSRERVAFALGPARILKALKKFHQGNVGFHTRTLIRSASRSINDHG